MTDYSWTVEDSSELEELVYTPLREDVTDREYVELSRDIAGHRDRVYEHFSQELEENCEAKMTSSTVFEAILEQTRKEAAEEVL